MSVVGMTARQKNRPSRGLRPAFTPIHVGEIDQKWGIDIVGPLAKAKENGAKYIIVSDEFLSKLVQAVCAANVSAVTVARDLMEGVSRLKS